MAFRLGLAQTRHPEDGNVVSLVENVASEAASREVDLLVFPESLMSRYEAEREQFVQEAQPVGGPFTQAVDAIAARAGLWIVYTMNEKNPDGGLPFNTAILTDSSGTRHGAYRKVHLFDSHSTTESSRMSAGNKLLAPIDTPFCKLGICICYDLRFPEAARFAATRGCELLVYPAAWVAGDNKILQWHTLLAARAIENGMFVAGVSRSDDGYIGSSAVFAPDGTLVAQADAGEQLIVCEIDIDAVREMREKIPVLEHLHPEAY